MLKNQSPVRYCRFMVDGRAYSGQIRDKSIDIVEGGPFTKTSLMRLSYQMNRVKFLPPFLPKQLWCIGYNYKEHAEELKSEIPKEPVVFIKATSSIIGSDDFIRIPDWAGAIHYEGELAVVIGKSGRNISEEDALDHVLGYTIMNDVTARELQVADGQWARSKSFDTFAPFGPAILFKKEMPEDSVIETRVNGKVKQRATLSQMIFPVKTLISYISRFATLEQGDVIATGTPSGIGPIKVGDIVEVEIDGIGKLKNVCAE